MSSKYNELAGAAPYFDDFNPKHNFMRILFNPSRAVQARELTQLQTILQNQSDQVARHLFKNNTTITGARISTIENKPAAYLERFKVDNDKTFDGSGSVDNYNTDPDGVFEDESVIEFDDTWIGVTFGNGNNPDGSDSDKQITISHYAYADNAGQSFPIIYYEFSGKNVKPGEIFRPVGEHAGSFPRIAIGWPTKNVGGLQNVISTDEENPFKAMAASGESGIVYSKGHFLTVSEKEIIASNDPSQGVIEIGYRIIQDIVTESNSEMVPADELDDEAGEVPLGRKLRDPASGSRNFNAPGAHRFRVRPELFAITYSDRDQRSTRIAEIENELGIDSLSEEFESFMVIDNGRVVKDQSEVQYADILKLLARRTYDESGNYTVDDFDLSLEEDPDDSSKFIAEMSPGKAYVKGFEVKKKISTRLRLDRARTTRLDDRTVKSLGALPYFVLQPADGTESGIECGSTDGNWIEVEKQEKVYILNKRIDPANPTFPANTDPQVIAETRTISIDRDEDYIRLYLEDVGNGADEIRNAKSIVAYRPDGQGGFTYAWVNLAQRRESGANKKTIPMFGGDIRPLLIKMNSKILKETSNHRYQVVERHVESSTSGASPTLTITLPSGQEFKNRRPLVLVYEDGSPQNVLDVSNMDVTWSPNEITFGGGGMAPSTSYVIYVKVQRIGASASPGSKSLSSQTKTITVNSYGEINGSETDEVLLDEDTYDIVDVYQTSNCAETNAAGDTEYKLSTDELLKLNFDDGQSDVQYEEGSVKGWKKLWRTNKATANDPTEYRIEYRKFTHSNAGAIHTVNSYPFGIEEQLKVPRYNSSRFGRIDLINCMDFRQTKTNLEGSISRCPLPLSTVEYAEEFYVGRIDVITLNKNGEFMVHEGVPSENPTPPNVPEGSMILYKLHIPAYTFSTRDIQIEAHKNTRYTMKDISRLEDRIDRLEDSVSLSLLEKNAMDMKITDPKTGFDRFKSGIFVDDFEGLSHTESADPEFYISVDRVERTIHCPVKKNNIGMNLSTSGFNQGVTEYANLVTLTPDTTERIVAQNDTATRTVNLNPYLFYTWVGSIELTPAVDTWHETNYLPQRNVTVGSWSPPEGFNPNWRIDDIEVNWVGVPPDPAPLPPQPSPPQNATQADDQMVRHTDILFSSQSMRDFMLLVSDGASPEEINDAAAEITDQLAGDNRRRASLMGAAIAARNSSGLDFDIDQELIDQALQVVGFDGETGTSTSLGSSNVLSSSDARSIASQIGSEQFDARGGNLAELNNQTTQPIGNRRIGNVISNNNNNSGAGDQATNQNTAVQQQTITEVRDVLTRHTDTNKEDRVIDRSEIYWMREQEIEFVGEGFRPGMLVTGYLDNKRVDIVPETNEFKFDDEGEDRVRVNSQGKVKGYFKIPPRKFTTGTKPFLLIDDEATSQGSADFTSKGMLTTRQEVITTTRSVETRQVFRTQNNDAEVIEQRPDVLEQILSGDFVDPVAQSFQISTEGGCLLSSISVYFATKAGDFRENSSLGSLNVVGRPSDDLTLSEALEDEFPGHPKDPLQFIGPSEIEYNAPVTLYLVEMRDGTPTSNIVPLSTVTKESGDVNSNPYVPQEGETEFRFNDPVYLEEGGEYAFVIVTTSKEYNVWMTELGEVDIFDGTEGVGVAEQPYLGSMFKSQNSSTWTAEQTQTMTFKAQRYNYSDNASGQVEFADSKFEDTLLHDENGARVNRPLYSSAFTGNPHDEKTYVSTIFPMFGEIALGETTIAWKHKFSSSVEMDMHNNKRNVVFNETFPTNEFVIDNTNDYLVHAYLSTNRSNLSPIIDTEQSRTIAIRNMVKGIEAFDGATLTFKEGLNSDGTGVLRDTEYTYQEKDAFKTTDGEAYIVMTTGVSFSTDDETTTTFKNELSNHVANEDIVMAANLDIEIDQNNVGNAGAYVSKPINLKSPADDLRLIMDSSEPGTSYIKPYYRILNHSPKFVVVKEQNDPSEDYRIHESMAGETERIFYVTTPSETVGPLSFESNDTTGNENFISINGFDSKTNETTGQPTKVAYFSGLTDNTAFNTANTSGRTGDYTAFATNSETLKRIISKGETIPFWDNSTSYLRGDVVYHAGAFWYSTGYVGSIPDWDGTTNWDEGEIVKHSGNLYLNRNAGVDSNQGNDPIDNPGPWKELSADYYGVGTVPTDPGSAWERIPSVFFKQNQDEIQTDDTSQWRPMVLKTGRFETNDFKNNKFYESTWVPKTEPGVEFNTFAVKLEFVTENSRAAVPRSKNLRVIATL